MSDMELKSLWDGMRQLAGRLREGRYWTERRDASEELFKIARQAAWRVRQAARDRDPDVAHWGGQAVTELSRFFTAPDDALAGKLDAELAAAGLDPDAPAPPLESLGVPPSGGIPDQAGTPEHGVNRPPTSPEALLGWIEAFAAQQGGTYAPRSSGAALTLNVAEGRRQTLYVDPGHKDSEGEPIALFYSLCGDARPEHFLWALQVNSTLSGGAFGVIQRGERSVLVLLIRQRLAELSEAWLRQRLFYLARKADWAEARLKEKDEY